MEASTQRESYAEWLARKMEEGGFSQRSLARKWNPDDPETARRAIRRYLNGMVPIERTRLELAAHLGSEETGPKEDTDDQEED